jgi:hypothetical protein
MPGLLSGIADGNFVIQGLASFGKNTADGNTPDTGNPLNFNLERKVNVAAELSFSMGATQKLAVGYACLIDFDKIIEDSAGNFYITCKMNWLRF